MEQNQALTVLVQAVNLAQKRGAFNLDEARAVADAVTIFTTPAQANSDAGTEEETNDVDTTED
mgnify:CR=1 FL=1|tara:strand:- start:1311 stop:1499 length:189 start_codon:yes stop_codon:yes gene_type:complete